MKKSLFIAAACASVLTATVLPPAAVAEPGPAATGSHLAGKTIFLDPGHQGTGHSENLARLVDDGRGGTKACQTTGMTTQGGVPEHTINWRVAHLVKVSIESLGGTVVLSRPDDTGWGGCIDERARAANKSGADVAISIHADSTSASADTTNHGFHLIVPELPIPDSPAQEAQSKDGRAASTMMRDAYVKNGFTPANYAGVVNGIQTRADVAGPALTTVPLVFVEMGNGSNPEDAALLESQDGQVKHAIAITTGIVDYLVNGGAADPNNAPDVLAAKTPAAGSASSEDEDENEDGAEVEDESEPETGETPYAAAPSTHAQPSERAGQSAETEPSTDSEQASRSGLLRPLLEALGVDDNRLDAAELVDMLISALGSKSSE